MAKKTKSAKIQEEEEDGCGSDEGHAASYKYKTGERVRTESGRSSSG